ncbi:MAG: recombinase family protein [Oscillospiraceae bacterium]|jgi:site-specific DNA recombinase|nr:recombinase family protein [Oscillospiraceae bacterium]
MEKLGESAIAIYMRGGDSERQETLCREYAMLYLGAGEDAGYLVYKDAGALGDGELPGLEKLRADAALGAFGTVVCAELGVLCRGSGELLDYSGAFRERGVSLIFVKERIDTASGAGKALLYSAELLMTLERVSAAANIRDNMRSLARTGRWLGGVTPTGYTSRRVMDAGSPEKIYRLELHPEQAKTIELIYSLFLERDSLSRVTQELEARGIATKNGREFSRFTVRQILENPVYMKADADAYDYFSRLGAEVCSAKEAFDGGHGMMVYNKTAQQQGETTHQREVTEWIAAVGEHRGIISAEHWIAAQNQLARNKSKTLRKPKSDHGLLAELLHCGYCGAHMRPKLSRQDDGSGDVSFSYLCERKEQSRSAECDMSNLPGQTADSSIHALLGAIDPGEPDIFPPQAERPVTPEAIAEQEERIAAMRATIAANDDGISRLVFSLIRAIDKNAYEEIIKQIDLLHAENFRLKAQIESMEALLGGHPLAKTWRDTLYELLTRWSERYPEMSMARKRATLRSLVDSVVWDGRELLVRFSGGAEFAVTPWAESF